MGFIFTAVFFVMLIIILFKEGWLKLLKILGLWVGSIILLGIILPILGIENDSTSYAVMNLLASGIWCLALVFYNIKEGYIGTF